MTFWGQNETKWHCLTLIQGLWPAFCSARDWLLASMWRWAESTVPISAALNQVLLQVRSWALASACNQQSCSSAAKTQTKKRFIRDLVIISQVCSANCTLLLFCCWLLLIICSPFIKNRASKKFVGIWLNQNEKSRNKETVFQKEWGLCSLNVDFFNDFGFCRL